jgi:uncharacterized protein YceH (UPF0502 family)
VNKKQTIMRQILAILISISILTACTSEPSNSSTPDGKSIDLETRIAQLEKENADKDEMINESLEFYNEIQSNLESIEHKKY